MVQLRDQNNAVVANYQYDAWGKLLYVYDNAGTEITDADHIALINPLRYRGYYYDSETGFYYLQSRYYDPVIRRFINADGFVSTGQGLLGYNMFTYCGNNPVCRIDESGKCYYNIYGEWCHDNWEYLHGYVRKPDPRAVVAVKEPVMIVTDENVSLPHKTVKVVDQRKAKDPNMKIVDSYKIKSKENMKLILEALLEYNQENPVDPAWERTLNSMIIEWDAHNFGYDKGDIAEFFGRKDVKPRCKDVDLNNLDEGRSFWGFFMK